MNPPSQSLIRCAALLAALAPTACTSFREPAPPNHPQPLPKLNPALSEVSLPASNGWAATLVLDNDGIGIWTVEAFQIIPQTGTPEVVGLDDLGRAHVCAGYSGKWTPTTVVSDGKWLGGLAHGDVDPRIAGEETYTGSQQGNLYQIVAWPQGVLDYRLIAHLPGKEIHTLLAGNLDASHPGPALLVFTRPGGIYRVTPTGPNGTFETTHLLDYDGRVRQALVLPADGNQPPSITTVSHNGRLELLRLTKDGPRWRTLYQDAMGLGRVALRTPADGEPLVLYTTHDDGRILRHQQHADDQWTTEVIHLGAQGPRGVVAGPFGKSPDLETVAIFGYDRQVQILTRTPGGWSAETVFEDTHKGHWLAVAELDGRNHTREILTSGYSGRIVLLSRLPGFGVPPAAPALTTADPAAQQPNCAAEADNDRETRIDTHIDTFDKDKDYQHLERAFEMIWSKTPANEDIVYRHYERRLRILTRCLTLRDVTYDLKAFRSELAPVIPILADGSPGYFGMDPSEIKDLKARKAYEAALAEHVSKVARDRKEFALQRLGERALHDVEVFLVSDRKAPASQTKSIRMLNKVLADSPVKDRLVRIGLNKESPSWLKEAVWEDTESNATAPAK